MRFFIIALLIASFVAVAVGEDKDDEYNYDDDYGYENTDNGNDEHFEKIQESLRAITDDLLKLKEQQTELIGLIKENPSPGAGQEESEGSGPPKCKSDYFQLRMLAPFLLLSRDLFGYVIRCRIKNI